MPDDTGADAARCLDVTTPTSRGTAIPFLYGFCVWGKNYTDMLCDVALPSLLSSNNLPAMPNNAVSDICIVTTPQDEANIRRHPVFAALTALIRCEFVHLPVDPETFEAPPGQAKKYYLMTIGHSVHVGRALRRACVVLLPPDAIYSDGMLPFLLGKIADGHQCVLGHGPRVCKESLVEDLRHNYGAGSGGPLTLPPREAVRLLLKHEHPDGKVLHWEDPNFSATPYMCVWTPPQRDGMLIRVFSMHPYILDYRDPGPDRLLPLDSTAIDGTFVIHSLVPWRRLHIVTDSDEFTVLSLTPEAEQDFSRDALRDPFISLCKWASKVDCEVLHRAYFMHAIRFHTGELNASWDTLERDTLRTAYLVMKAAARASRWDFEEGITWDPEFEARRQNLMKSHHQSYAEEFGEMMRVGGLTASLKTARYKFAAPLLRETDDVLEVGASTGTGSVYLAKRVARVTALETRPLDHATAVAINNRPNLNFRLQSVFDYVPERPHDVVIALDSCEDIGPRDLDRLIAAMARHLKPDGWLLIGAPNLDVRRLRDATPHEPGPGVTTLDREQVRMLVARHFRKAHVGVGQHTAPIGWYYFVRGVHPRHAG